MVLQLQILVKAHSKILIKTHPLGDTKRKALPLWLREALEKMERDKQKKLEKESKEAERKSKGEGEGRPTWRDELEVDEEEREQKARDWEEPGGRLKRSYRFHSKSPKEVSVLVLTSASNCISLVYIDVDCNIKLPFVTNLSL